MPSDPAVTDPTVSTVMLTHDEYPLTVDLTPGTSDPVSVAEADAILIARGIASPEPSHRDGLRNEVFREDFSRPLQHFEAIQKGQIRVGRESDPTRDFLGIPKVNSHPLLLEGLHRRQIQLPDPDNRIVWAVRTARTPVLEWLQGWGQPYEDAGNPLRDPGITPPTALNVNEDGSIDPIGPGTIDPNFRFLRKPALDDPEATPPVYTSEEARRQVWHSLASGSQGFGVFAQFYVADQLLARVWTPLIWEVQDYQDLRWNREVLSHPVAVPGREVVTWTTSTLTGGPDGPISPEPHDIAWLPPRLGILKRIKSTSYMDHTVSPAAERERRADEVVLFLFNRSNAPLEFHVNMNLRSETDPARGAMGKQWQQHRYRQATGDPVTPEGLMHFEVEAYGVQIWHLE